MKNILKKIIQFYFHFKFSLLVRKSNKPIVIIDIDNTIADTWPSINAHWKSIFERHIALKPFKKVIEFINTEYSPKNYTWVYLTSRKYQLRGVTKKWLIENNMQVSNNIIIVQSPKEKVELYKKYLNKSFVLFDDLSYNHENGIVKFYENEIDYIRTSKHIIYFGYNQLIPLQQNNE